MELQADLARDVPAERGADEAGAEVVDARLRVAQDDAEVLGHVVEEDQQRGLLGEDGLRPEDPVHEPRPVRRQREVLRVPRADELHHHLHQLLARQLRPRQPLQHRRAVLRVQRLPLRDARPVRRLQLDPPVRLEFRQRCSAFRIPSVSHLILYTPLVRKGGRGGG